PSVLRAVLPMSEALATVPSAPRAGPTPTEPAPLEHVWPRLTIGNGGNCHYAHAESSRSAPTATRPTTSPLTTPRARGHGTSAVYLSGSETLTCFAARATPLEVQHAATIRHGHRAGPNFPTSRRWNPKRNPKVGRWGTPDPILY